MMMGSTNWTGFYLGANGGGGTGNSNFSYHPSIAAGVGGAPTSTSGNFNYEGPFGGGTIGYNWQFSPTWVWGLEGDIDGSGIRGGTYCGAGTTVHCSLSNTWMGTVRGRLGWAPNAGNSLLYITGGAAFGDINISAPGPTSTGTTNVGWTAGAGLEYMIGPQWSVKVEYRHTDLGSATFGINPAATGGVATSAKVNLETDAGLLGLNFHFGAPPPPPPAPMAMPAPPPAAARVFIVFFDWDKDVVTPEGMQIIQQAADAYRSGAPVQLQVTGYTDRSGSPGYNQRLSERRANNVARALAALGVPKDQMVVGGRGENDNRVPTAPGVREPQNRRVEIVAP
jgi:outer membrane protein OmpA-like peptidoglycan-associated protein